MTLQPLSANPDREPDTGGRGCRVRVNQKVVEAFSVTDQQLRTVWALKPTRLWQPHSLLPSVLEQLECRDSVVSHLLNRC